MLSFLASHTFTVFFLFSSQTTGWPGPSLSAKITSLCAKSQLPWEARWPGDLRGHCSEVTGEKWHWTQRDVSERPEEEAEFQVSEATGEASRVRLPFQTLGLWRRTNVGKKEKRSKETDTRKIRTREAWGDFPKNASWLTELDWGWFGPLRICCSGGGVSLCFSGCSHTPRYKSSSPLLFKDFWKIKPSNRVVFPGDRKMLYFSKRTKDSVEAVLGVIRTKTGLFSVLPAWIVSGSEDFFVLRESNKRFPLLITPCVPELQIPCQEFFILLGSILTAILQGRE